MQAVIGVVASFRFFRKNILCVINVITYFRIRERKKICENYEIWAIMKFLKISIIKHWNFRIVNKIINIRKCICLTPMNTHKKENDSLFFLLLIIRK